MDQHMHWRKAQKDGAEVHVTSNAVESEAREAAASSSVSDQAASNEREEAAAVGRSRDFREEVN